jgi:hypothetical protein
LVVLTCFKWFLYVLVFHSFGMGWKALQLAQPCFFQGSSVPVDFLLGFPGISPGEAMHQKGVCSGHGESEEGTESRREGFPAMVSGLELRGSQAYDSNLIVLMLFTLNLYQFSGMAGVSQFWSLVW